MNMFIKTLLIISGITGIGIGCSLLFFPVAFEASAGIHVGDNVSLLSEIRAPGGVLITGGVIIVSGVFVSTLTHTSLLISTLIYLSYGISRIIGVIADGFPHKALLIALFVELLVGLISLFVFIRFNRKRRKNASISF